MLDADQRGMLASRQMLPVHALQQDNYKALTRQQGSQVFWLTVVMQMTGSDSTGSMASPLLQASYAP